MLLNNQPKRMNFTNSKLFKPPYFFLPSRKKTNQQVKI